MHSLKMDNVDVYNKTIASLLRNMVMHVFVCCFACG